jgi:hypothetical protein
MDRRVSVPHGAASAALLLYPPEGVATAGATVSIFEGGDSNDESALITGSASLDSVNLSPSVAAGYSQSNRKRITFAATTNVAVDRQYALSENGRTEVVTVKGLTATTVDLEFDLAYDYTTAATFKGLLHTFALPGSLATFLSDEQYLNDEGYPYRVLWAYTAGGQPCRHWTMFDVVRVVAQESVTLEDLADVFRDLVYMADHDRIRRAIRESQMQLDVDLKLRGYDPAKVAPGTMRDQLVKLGAVAGLAKQGIAPPGMDRQVHRAEAIRSYLDAVAVAAPKLERLDARGDGQSTTEPRRLGFRS